VTPQPRELTKNHGPAIPLVDLTGEDTLIDLSGEDIVLHFNDGYGLVIVIKYI